MLLPCASHTCRCGCRSWARFVCVCSCAVCRSSSCRCFCGAAVAQWGAVVPFLSHTCRSWACFVAVGPVMFAVCRRRDVCRLIFGASGLRGAEARVRSASCSWFFRPRFHSRRVSLDDPPLAFGRTAMGAQVGPRELRSRGALSHEPPSRSRQAGGPREASGPQDAQPEAAIGPWADSRRPAGNAAARRRILSRRLFSREPMSRGKRTHRVLSRSALGRWMLGRGALGRKPPGLRIRSRGALGHEPPSRSRQAVGPREAQPQGVEPGRRTTGSSAAGRSAANCWAEGTAPTGRRAAVRRNAAGRLATSRRAARCAVAAR